MKAKLLTELNHLDELECIARGCLINAEVETENGVYNLYFTDPIRLQQDINEEFSQGSSFFTEPGIIILPKVSLENIEKAINNLLKQKYFDSLKPIKK